MSIAYTYIWFFFLSWAFGDHSSQFPSSEARSWTSPGQWRRMEMMYVISRLRQGRVLVWLILLSFSFLTEVIMDEDQCWDRGATQKKHPESWVTMWRIVAVENHPELHCANKQSNIVLSYWVYWGLFVTVAYRILPWLIQGIHTDTGIGTILWWGIWLFRLMSVPFLLCHLGQVTFTFWICFLLSNNKWLDISRELFMLNNICLM